MRVTVVDPDLVRELRRSVLRPDHPVGAPLPGDDRPDAVYLGAFDDAGDVVGTCLVVPEPDPSQPAELPARQVRQMAVRPDTQGRGVGSAVLAAALQHARASGALRVWCNARRTATGFYARHGFVAHGGEFVEPATGLVHVLMGIDLSTDHGTAT